MPEVEIAIALIWRNGRLLVTFRPSDAGHLPGCLEFPGGKREPGESLEQCIVRECAEETGLQVQVRHRRAPIHHAYSDRMVILHPFDCELIGEEPPTCEGRWLLPRELVAADFPPANSSLIEELRQNSVIATTSPSAVT